MLVRNNLEMNEQVNEVNVINTAHERDRSVHEWHNSALF